MNKNRKMFIVVLFAFVVCFSLAGCSLQEKIKEYSSDKEQCYLNAENVTQFSFKGNDYTILEDTVSNGGLGEWTGYIRQLVAVDETGKVLLQENIETTTFRTLADLADKAPEAAYIIPFLNVYAAPNADDYLIVDVNGGYPAVRICAVRPHLAAVPAPSGHPGVARAFDVIALTGRERKGSPPFLRPWPAGSLGDWVACVGRTLTY